MGTMHLHPASQPNMPAVARILSRYDRESLEAFLEVALELLDTMDGNPDLEDGGDNEPDGDAQGDVSWSEWHTRTLRTQRKAGAEMASTREIGDQEDDENDDPAEEDDDSGDHASEDEPAGYRAQSRSDFGPGCPISDPGGGNVGDECQIDAVPPYTGPLS